VLVKELAGRQRADCIIAGFVDIPIPLFYNPSPPGEEFSV
jgi:hypothetical protein